MPNDWTDICADITNLAELKVVQYILRHTWGYQEYDLHKHITVDEFIRGRRRRDGSRLDKGTGLSEQSVRNGLDAAKTHGWIEEFIDGSDKARIKKYYRLKMREGPIAAESHDYGQPDEAPHSLGSEVQDLGPEVKDVDLWGPDIGPRSETDTSNQPFERRVHSTVAPSTDAGPAVSGASNGLDDTGDRPARSSPHQRGRGPTHDVPVAIAKIAAAMKELSEKLGDGQHQGSNKAQAMNLFLASGLTDERFVHELYETSAVTRDEANRLRQNGKAIANQMAYFFAVLRDRLGKSPSRPKDGHPDGRES